MELWEEEFGVYEVALWFYWFSDEWFLSVHWNLICYLFLNALEEWFAEQHFNWETKEDDQSFALYEKKSVLALVW